MTITEFLEARIAEDEAEARGAIGTHWGHAFQQVRTECGDDPHYYKIASGQVGLEHWEPTRRLDSGTTFQHIARHDPARVLAECAAKRATLAAHPVTVQLWWEEQCDIEVCSTCQEDSYPDRWPCPTIQALAAVYASHPDYLPEWAL